MGTASESVRRLRSGDATAAEIVSALADPSIVVRANALEALTPHARLDPALLDRLAEAATSPENATRLMGTISVAHVAVAALLRVGTPGAEAAARRLLEDWPEPDRSDLLWYLSTEGLADRPPQARTTPDPSDPARARRTPLTPSHD
ncbi:MAG: hypothetical protein K2X91_04580 [Thermoleophilia bacterium]|nr:hypothetical protein [Thermoleophilia bacterium]